MKNSEDTYNRRTVGHIGEAVAVKHLVSKGYSILERNYHSRYGEIDIIAGHDSFVVFVEVKYRKDTAYGQPSMAVDFKKQVKLKKTALMFIADRNLNDKDFRFDVIEITGAGLLQVNHIVNAFS